MNAIIILMSISVFWNPEAYTDNSLGFTVVVDFTSKSTTLDSLASGYPTVSIAAILANDKLPLEDREWLDVLLRTISTLWYPDFTAPFSEAELDDKIREYYQVDPDQERLDRGILQYQGTCSCSGEYISRYRRELFIENTDNSEIVFESSYNHMIIARAFGVLPVWFDYNDQFALFGNDTTIIKIGLPLGTTHQVDLPVNIAQDIENVFHLSSCTTANIISVIYYEIAEELSTIKIGLVNQYTSSSTIISLDSSNALLTAVSPNGIFVAIYGYNIFCHGSSSFTPILILQMRNGKEAQSSDRSQGIHDP